VLIAERRTFLKGFYSLVGLLQPMSIVRVNELEVKVRVGLKVLWFVAEHILDHWTDVLVASEGCKTILVIEILSVLNHSAETNLGLMQFLWNILSLSLAFVQFLLDKLDGDLVDGFSYVSLCQYVSPLYFS
jgi:hypothetical protein